MSDINSSRFSVTINRASSDTQIGINGKTSEVIVYKGTTLLTPVSTTPTDGQYRVTLTCNGCVAKLKNDNKTIYVESISRTSGNISVAINVEGRTTYIKNISVEKVVNETEVSNMKTNISIIEQKADRIETTVQNMNGDISNLKQTATSLTTRITSAEGNISTINQTASKISWVIKGGSSSSSMTLTDDFYNLVSNNITLRANRIKLEGYTTINGNFSIDTGGTMSCINANISGTIKASDIIGSNISGTNIDGGTVSGATVNGGTIIGATIQNSATLPSFKVTPDGTVTASKMNITGGKIDVGTSNFIIRSAHLYMQDGDVSISNNCGFRAKDSSGNTCTMMVLNADDTMRFGWGSWDVHSDGVFYGGVEYMGGKRTVLRGASNTYLVCNSGTYNSTGGSSIVFMHNGTDYVFRPVAGGKTTCGTKAYPWSNVYGNAITNLSDRTLKENIKYVKDTSLCNDEVEVEKDITIKDMYEFMRDDCALATYNYINDKHKNPKLNFIANDIIINQDGSDNKVGQLIVNPKVDKVEGGILAFDMGNYISVIGGALQGTIKKIETLEAEINKLRK